MLFCKKVKEIVNKEGERIFTRFALIQTSLFAIYIHKLFKSDADPYPHNHPWNYLSFVLKGGYREFIVKLRKSGERSEFIRCRKLFSLVVSSRHTYHRVIKLRGKPTVTFFVTWGRYKDWHYLNESNEVVLNTEFRKQKSPGLIQTTQQ